MKKLFLLLLIVHFQFSVFNCFGQVSLSDLDKGNASNVVWGIYNDVASSSTGNLYAISVPSMYEYVPGMIINFKAGFTNSDSAYLKVNELATVPIVKQDTLLLDSGDVIKGKMVSVIYDGLYFNLINNEQIIQNHGCWIDSLVGTKNFTIPDKITCINLILIGSGGGGCTFYDGNSWISCQGGNGGYFKGRIKVSPGEKITIVIGSPGSHSSNGAESYFKDGNNNNVITVKGGCGMHNVGQGCDYTYPFCKNTTTINNFSRIIGDYTTLVDIMDPNRIRNRYYGMGEDLINPQPYSQTPGYCMIVW